MAAFSAQLKVTHATIIGENDSSSSSSSSSSSTKRMTTHLASPGKYEVVCESSGSLAALEGHVLSQPTTLLEIRHVDQATIIRSVPKTAGVRHRRVSNIATSNVVDPSCMLFIIIPDSSYLSSFIIGCNI